ncbi:MAG: hypothetical protein WDZ69_01805 [Candidatus Pacearchaeota archaeon]
MEARISALENGESYGEGEETDKKENRGLRGIFNSILGGGFDEKED